MDGQFLGHELEEWYPQEPTKGPPLPRFLNIYWPWYKGAAPPPVVYTCPYCGATFATEAEKNYHIQTQHAAPPEYTCPYCGATFATEAERDYHVQTQHPAPPPPAPTGGRIYIPPEEPPVGEATLYGVVTRGGEPAVGVEVKIVGDMTPGYSVDGTPLSAKSACWTATDGSYLIWGMAVGTYRLTIIKSFTEQNVVLFEGSVTLHEGNNERNILL